ncbi:hypothetical protein [Methanoregula sp.]|uniref:hypothetical protein n=1 Tax=Methanoregula sp. TaxID=2052170 RepID=UPI003C7967EA
MSTCLLNAFLFISLDTRQAPVTSRDGHNKRIKRTGSNFTGISSGTEGLDTIA